MGAWVHCEFAPHTTQKLIARSKLTFDERAVVHGVATLSQSKACHWATVENAHIDSRTTTSQKWQAVPRRARNEGP